MQVDGGSGGKEINKHIEREERDVTAGERDRRLLQDKEEKQSTHTRTNTKAEPR